MVQLSHPYMTTGKTIALTRLTFVNKIMSLDFLSGGNEIQTQAAESRTPITTCILSQATLRWPLSIFFTSAHLTSCVPVCSEDLRSCVLDSCCSCKTRNSPALSGLLGCPRQFVLSPTPAHWLPSQHPLHCPLGSLAHSHLSAGPSFPAPYLAESRALCSCL